MKGICEVGSVLRVELEVQSVQGEEKLEITKRWSMEDINTQRRSYPPRIVNMYPEEIPEAKARYMFHTFVASK